MADHDDNVTLRQMLDYSQEAVDMVQGHAEHALDEDRKLFLSVVKLLEMVGEAATRLSQERRQELSQIPWRQIKV